MRVLFLGLVCLFLLTACGVPGSAQVVEDREASAMDGAEAESPSGGETAFPLPSPKTGPVKIGIQAGHWKVAELPDELARRRNSTGAQYGQLKEVDVNLKVAQTLVGALAKRGYQAELLPATVPPNYEADLFISIHADWGATAKRRGWKLSPPWRSNEYSRLLSDSIASAFAASIVPEDTGGVTNGMRGYFGFNYRRHEHAVSPYTPAVLVEMGFLTNAEDRALLRDQPALLAGIIEKGIVAYLSKYDRSKLASYVPPVFPWLSAGSEGAVAYASPSSKGEKLRDLPEGTVVFPIEQRGDWYEVFIRGLRRSAWIEAARFEKTFDPNWPLPGETNNQ